MSALQTIFDNLTGIQAAYLDAPTNPSESVFPFALVYLANGTLTPMGATLDKQVHVVHAEIHQAKTVVSAAMSAVHIWPDRVIAALIADTTLATAGATIAFPVAYVAGPMEYANYVHYGMRFILSVKLH
jgi:hypothetical protein